MDGPARDAISGQGFQVLPTTTIGTNPDRYQKIWLIRSCSRVQLLAAAHPPRVTPTDTNEVFRVAINSNGRRRLARARLSLNQGGRHGKHHAPSAQKPTHRTPLCEVKLVGRAPQRPPRVAPRLTARPTALGTGVLGFEPKGAIGDRSTSPDRWANRRPWSVALAIECQEDR